MRSMKSGMYIASAAALLALAGCNLDQSPKPAASAEKDVTVATVNGTAIGKSRIDMLLSQGAGQGRPDTPETRQAIIDQLAMQMVIAEEATKKGMDKLPEVTERLEMVRQSVLANAYVQDFMKAHPVTDEALKAEYERIKTTVTGSQYKARHILVEKEDQAKAIIAQIKKGAKFDDLAKKASKDPGSAVKGGELDWANPGSYVKEFSDALVTLGKGKMTENPVKSQFGFHIIRVDDVREATVPKFDEVKPQIAQHLSQQKLAKYQEELRSKAKVE